MKRTFNFQNKTFLKYLIVILLILLTGSFLLLRSYKNTPSKEVKKKDNSAEIKRFTDLGDQFYNRYSLDTALIYFNKALILCDPKKNTQDYVYAAYSIAYAYNEKGDYIASEAAAILALPYLKNLKKTRHAWIVYTLLGANYSSMYDYNNAILYHKKARNLKTSVWRKGLAINNIASAYMNQEKYTEAIKLFKTLMSPKFKPENNSGYGYVRDNLGYCYYKTGNFKKALEYYYKGLHFRLQPNQNAGLINSYINLSVYFEKRNMKLAKMYAMKVYKHALSINHLPNITTGLGLLTRTSEGADLKKYSLLYIKASNNLLNKRQKAKNQFANVKYNFNKDKEENLQLRSERTENELQIERQKNRNIVLAIVILFAIGAFTLLYFYLSSKAIKEKNEEIYKSEIRISKKLHDELANTVYQTLAFAQNKDLELSENRDRLLNNLQVIYSRTRNISKENSTIITDENYVIVLKEMISEFKSSKNNLFLNGIENISWNEIEKNKKITVYRVLQELLVNMKKHSEASLIGINFKKTDKSVIINYTDNGKGIDVHNIIFKNGLHNVESRILSIKGEIDIDTAPEKGFKVFIKFPL